MTTTPFSGCHFPALDWAVHTTGRSGSFEARKADVAGNYLFVVGDIRSIDPTDVGSNAEDNFSLTGPFTKDNRSGYKPQRLKPLLNIKWRDQEHPIKRCHRYRQDYWEATRCHSLSKFSYWIHLWNWIFLGIGGKFTGSDSFPEAVSCLEMRESIYSVSRTAFSNTSEGVTAPSTILVDAAMWKGVQRS